MTAAQTQRGFTLVELAIVMSIIGLLVGGILKGQEMLQNARVVSTVAQVKSYQAAVISFRDMYQVKPGDMPNAASRLVGCNANCNPAPATAGNGIVGNPAWSATWGLQGTSTTTPPAAADDETWLFWQHLSRSNLISDVSLEGIGASTPYGWNRTHPAAPVGGGFVVGYSDGNNLVPGNNGANCRKRKPNFTCQDLDPGMVLALLRTPFIPPSTIASGSQQLQPTIAGRIDTKLDDGEPDTGSVVAFGNALGCFEITGKKKGAGKTDPEYDDVIGTSDCGLFFLIEQ